MKMSLNTKEKEASLTPCLRITLWPCLHLEISSSSRIPDHLIPKNQTVAQSKERNKTSHLCLGGNISDLWKGYLWFIAFTAGPAGRIEKPWICFRQHHLGWYSSEYTKGSSFSSFWVRANHVQKPKRQDQSSLLLTMYSWVPVAVRDPGRVYQVSLILYGFPPLCCRGSVFG